MLRINNVSKFFGEGQTAVTALDDVTLRIDSGDFIAIMGPSGSGKSTLLNIIGGLDRLSSGEVILEGGRIDNLEENALVHFRRGRVAYIFQQYHLLPSLSALENVLLPLIFSDLSNGKVKALEMLSRVGLENRTDHKPSELSGGEQQRVAIARALVVEPSLILADEPTGNMDRDTGRNILNLLVDLHSNDGNTIIIVTHDHDIANYANKTIFLQDGRIVNQTV